MAILQDRVEYDVDGLDLSRLSGTFQGPFHSDIRALNLSHSGEKCDNEHVC